jgi:uncharacterized protein
MKKTLSQILTILIVAFFTIHPAIASDLMSAKNAGQVGELPNGLVEVISPNALPDILDLVQKTNNGRMNVYRQMASEQGVPLSQIQALAAEKILSEMKGSGQYAKVNGSWRKQ